MNCFEFRKHCVAEPGSTAAEYRRHRAECAACAAFAARQDDFERELAKALEVDVPAGLDARLILRQTTQRSFFSVKRALAYAASLLVVVGVLLTTIWGPRSPDIEELVIGHILEEPQHLMSEDEVPASRAAAVLARVGVQLRGSLGLIRFVETCPGRRGVHLVLPGAKGPVTVMIMPATPVAARQILARGDLTGFVAPAGAGSLAIVGFAGEPIEEHERRVRAAIAINA